MSRTARILPSVESLPKSPNQKFFNKKQFVKAKETSSDMLSDQELNEYYRTEPRFGGVFPQGALRKAKPNKFYILNLDEPTGEGSHWVLLSMLNPKRPFYVDSFGVPPDSIVVQAIRGKKSTPKILYNQVQIQGLENSDCGSFCVDIANHLLKGQSPEKVMDMFSLTNFRENARDVRQHAEVKQKVKRKKSGKFGTGVPITW